MEFSNGKEKMCKILAKNNLINITWTCPLNVFPSGNSYDICSTIWKRIYKNITLWLCHLKVLMLACDNVDTFNIFTIYIFQVRKTNYLIFFWYVNGNIIYGNVTLTYSHEKKLQHVSKFSDRSIFKNSLTMLLLP